MKRGLGRAIGAGALFCAGVLLAGAAQAQAKSASPAKDSPATDMRAVFAGATEIAEGKKVAQASCANCHGIDGLSTGKNVPNIAGQRPGYLYAEMRVYQAGGRPDKAMGDAVKFMNDDALVKVAAYYASLEPAAPAAAAETKAAAAKAAARGRPGQGRSGGCRQLCGLPW